MLGNPTLVEHDIAFYVDAAGQKRRGHFADVLAKLGRIMRHRHRVQVDHAIEAGMGRLHLDEALERAQIITKMQIAGRLHAGKHQLGELRHQDLSKS
jgi:hypothetical protein